MRYILDIRAAQNNPQQLEEIYQAARRVNAFAEFKDDVLACYAESPQNVLYAAWYYRLQQPVADEGAERRTVNWRLAIPLSLLTGVLLALLTNERLVFKYSGSQLPYVALLGPPIVALIAIAFLSATAHAGYRRALFVGGVLVALSAYVMLWAGPRRAYGDLMMPHLPLLAFAAVGVSILGLRPNPRSVFAFLSKAIEVAVTAGVYGIAMFIFVGISTAMFDALGIRFTSVVMAALLLGIGGLIPMIAVASVYDPLVGPIEQEFKRGLAKMVALLPRLLLPLTLVVLVIYLIAIPFNFMAPFRSRDVLVVYNGMLFAVMALLVGATPLGTEDLAPRYETALRRGIRGVAILVALVSLYALSATVYRTVLNGLTPNRLTIIGWNSIHIGLLVFLIVTQFRHDATRWAEALHRVFRVLCIAYVLWAGFLLLATPWLFGW